MNCRGNGLCVIIVGNCFDLDMLQNVPSTFILFENSALVPFRDIEKIKLGQHIDRIVRKTFLHY